MPRPTKEIRKMCANCKHVGKMFTSAYSGKEMACCKLDPSKGGQFAWQSCDKWEHYRSKE